jgi:hypothetical protein
MGWYGTRSFPYHFFGDDISNNNVDAGLSTTHRVDNNNEDDYDDSTRRTDVSLFQYHHR